MCILVDFNNNKNCWWQQKQMLIGEEFAIFFPNECREAYVICMMQYDFEDLFRNYAWMWTEWTFLWVLYSILHGYNVIKSTQYYIDAPYKYHVSKVINHVVYIFV